MLSEFADVPRRSCCEDAVQELFDKSGEMVKNAKTQIEELRARALFAEKRCMEGERMFVQESSRTAKIELKCADLTRFLDMNKKIILSLRKDVDALRKDEDAGNRVIKALEAKVFELKNAKASELSKGAYSCVFSRSESTVQFPSDLAQIAISCQRQWNELHPTNDLTYGVSGVHAYGEPTFVAMARICHVISSKLQHLGKTLTPDDIFLDWGSGAGKWLCFARQLLGVPEMIALGIEKDQVIFDICKRNLSDIKRSNVLYAHSESFTSFCPVRVFYNYDGGNQAMQRTVKGRIHQTIIRTAFCSPTVDVVVSTRLNWDKFWGYFSKHLHKLCGSLWKCIYIKNCNFQGSKFNVNVWFCLSPMHACISFVDKRMEKLLSGSLFCSSDETYLC